MRLRDANKLKVGDIVQVPYLGIARGEILAVMPDEDPRIKLVLRVEANGGMTFNLNYLHLRKRKHAD